MHDRVHIWLGFLMVGLLITTAAGTEWKASAKNDGDASDTSSAQPARAAAAARAVAQPMPKFAMAFDLWMKQRHNTCSAYKKKDASASEPAAKGPAVPGGGNLMPLSASPFGAHKTGVMFSTTCHTFYNQILTALYGSPSTRNTKWTAIDFPETGYRFEHNDELLACKAEITSGAKKGNNHSWLVVRMGDLVVTWDAFENDHAPRAVATLAVDGPMPSTNNAIAATPAGYNKEKQTLYVNPHFTGINCSSRKLELTDAQIVAALNAYIEKQWKVQFEGIERDSYPNYHCPGLSLLPSVAKGQ